MEHSDEYYKMKYFKYKAKYIAELERQKGGSKSKSSPKKNESSGVGKFVSAVGNGIVAGASAVGNIIATGASAVGKGVGKGFKALAKKSTDKREVIKALNELNKIYIEMFPDKNNNNNEFINYLKDQVTIKTTITDFKKYLDEQFFNNKNMKKFKDFKDSRIKAKKVSYEILDKECTPYFGREIQESCTKIFQDNNIYNK
jgi:hypothetical protein